MEFYDWLVAQGKTSKTAKNYSGPISGRLSGHATLIVTPGFDHNELSSDSVFRVYCEKNDPTGELYNLNLRGKDMYRRSLVMYSEYVTATRKDAVGFSEVFENKVSISKTFTQIERLKRLKTASAVPTKTSATIDVFDRNPDVVAEVLFRAKGLCEHCKDSAPFIRKSDNTPYLEVHHKKSLAKGGEDSIDNAEALCPNCHREKHYGA